MKKDKQKKSDSNYQQIRRGKHQMKGNNATQTGGTKDPGEYKFKVKK